MSRNLLIRGARQLLTLHGSSSGPRRGDSMQDLGIIEDGSVLIAGGAIASVGPTRRVENLAEARSAEEINASGHVVMPGFVDSFAGLFGVPGRLLARRSSGGPQYQAGAPLEGQDLTATLNYLRNTAAGTLEFHAARHLEGFLRHGTTSVEARSGFGLTASGEMKLVRVLNALDGKCLSIIPTYLAGHYGGAEGDRSRTYVDWLCAEIIPRLAERRSARFVEAACGENGLSLPDARKLLDAVRRASLTVKVSVAGPSASDAIALAIEVDAASVSGINSASAEEAARLGRTRCLATLLPARMRDDEEEGLRLARRLIDAGVAVAFGSGFEPSTCSTLNMQHVISMAWMRMNVTPEEAISAATINSAHALGLGGRVGSLEFGKDADVCILNVPDYREIPLNVGSNLVSLVLRKGVVAHRSGSVSCGEN
ncbi:MAG: amidohydrolase family protein [Bryobacteraceae bacterium]|nr:amidohydrolase family protein [Bryobacteraceae bacterium]